MPTADETVLTERQVEVLELREQGHTQRAIAERLGTTDSNVSAIERAARANVQKARKTLQLVETLQSPVQFTVPAGTEFETLVDEVYAQGDEAGITIAHHRPELYAHLYDQLQSQSAENQLTDAAEIGITDDGAVTVSTDTSASSGTV
jgi:Tfx family DNA-binding protein